MAQPGVKRPVGMGPHQSQCREMRGLPGLTVPLALAFNFIYLAPIPIFSFSSLDLAVVPVLVLRPSVPTDILCLKRISNVISPAWFGLHFQWLTYVPTNT